MERKITNPTYEMYTIYKARKNYLESQIETIKNLDLLTDKGRTQILEGLEYEVHHIQSKIDDLLW